MVSCIILSEFLLLKHFIEKNFHLISVLELMFLETSALTGEGVQEVFLKCARTILSKIESGKILHSTHLIFKGQLNPESMNSGVQPGSRKPQLVKGTTPKPNDTTKKPEGGCNC